MDSVVACETCGLVQRLPAMPVEGVAECARCRFKLVHRRFNSRWQTLALSLAALILYFPSNYYPLVDAYYMGNHAQMRILDGIRSLFERRQYFIASLVFCTSILTPALKIIGLIFICLTLKWKTWLRTRTWIYRCIRVVDPWNMLEVYLLSVMISMVELGEVATVHPAAGVFSFAAVVVLTLLATLSFDPRLIWDNANEQNYEETSRRQPDA